MLTHELDTDLAKRVIVLVLDSVGVGALPDAATFGDEGSNTLANVAASVAGLKVPHLAEWGLGNIVSIAGVPPTATSKASFGKMAEKSNAKDTTSGHWELAGLVVVTPFPVYPKGFPLEVISAIESVIGRKVIGNIAASGTWIIEQLGEEHTRTGYPIVYTSADSVLQIAAHEDVIPVEQLYWMCKSVRNLMIGEHKVGRVIARPFIGSPGRYQRTERRRDFSLEPHKPTMLDLIKDSGLEVVTIGKVDDIFAGRGITRSLHTVNNQEAISCLLLELQHEYSGLIFANLVDFDSLYGHRNDPVGYARALSHFDESLLDIEEALKPGDMMIITADHGCDPTTSSTDHSREYVPLLVYGQRLRAGIDLGVRETFADVAVTCCDYLVIEHAFPGKSFLSDVSF